MDDEDVYDDPDGVPERIYIAMIRRCLKCGVSFESEWSGERVCRRCKGSALWREGTIDDAATPRHW